MIAVPAMMTRSWRGGARGLAGDRGEHGRDEALKSAAAETAAKDTASTKEAETRAVLGFVEQHILAAARPKGQEGGLGPEVTLLRPSKLHCLRRKKLQRSATHRSSTASPWEILFSIWETETPRPLNTSRHGQSTPSSSEPITLVRSIA